MLEPGAWSFGLWRGFDELPVRGTALTLRRMSAPKNTFWNKHPGLVWSNPAADDSAHIRAALIKPQFSRLLDITIEFGFERLDREWIELQNDDSREVVRARSAVERILTHIQQGFAIAATRH